MTRPRGGFIGHNAAPAASALNSAASGVWTPREAEALKRAGTWPIAFNSPTQISGLQLWLDAADSSTLYDATTGGSLVAANGGVARWEDKSGNNRHFTQSDSSKRPARKVAEQNGLDALLFDGTNDVLNGGNIISGLTGLSIFVVLKRANTSASHRIFHKIEDGLPGWATTALSGGALRHEAYANAALDQYTEITSSSAVTLSSYSLLQVSVPSGSVGTTTMRRNAAAITMNSPVNVGGGAANPASSSASLLIGSNRYQGIDYNLWNGNVAEIAIYNTALSDANRELVEDYLLAKWGIT